MVCTWTRVQWTTTMTYRREKCDYFGVHTNMNQNQLLQKVFVFNTSLIGLFSKESKLSTFRVTQYDLHNLCVKGKSFNCPAGIWRLPLKVDSIRPDKDVPVCLGCWVYGVYSVLYLQVVKLGSTSRKDIFQFEINRDYSEQRGPLAPLLQSSCGATHSHPAR